MAQEEVSAPRPPRVYWAQRCDRCGGQLPRALEDSPAKLAECYYAHLCAPCLNAWNKYILAHADWRAFEDFKASIEIDLARAQGGRDVNVPEMMDDYASKARRHRKLYDIVHAWVTQKPAQDEQHGSC